MTWLRAHWRPVAAALALLLAFMAGFARGRRGPAPDKVTEKTHTQTSAKVEKTEDVKAAVKIEAAQKKTTHRNLKVVTHTDKKPGGETVIDKTVTVVDGTDTTTTAGGTESSDNRSKSNQASSSVVDTSKVTTYRRDWKAGVLLGAELQNPLRNAGNPIGSFLGGVQLEHRTSFIPLPGLDRGWIGIWVMAGPNTTAAGLPTPRVMGGLSLGVEF